MQQKPREVETKRLILVRFYIGKYLTLKRGVIV